MGLCFPKSSHKLIYSWYKLISGLSEDFESSWFKLSPILSDPSPILGFCSQNLLISTNKLFKTIEIQEIFLSVSFGIYYSTHLYVLIQKTMSFIRKLFSNLIFGDDFTSTGSIWMYHDFFYVLRSKLQSKEVKIML